MLEEYEVSTEDAQALCAKVLEATRQFSGWKVFYPMINVMFFFWKEFYDLFFFQSWIQNSKSKLHLWRKVAAPMEAPIDDLAPVDEKFLCYIPPLLCKLDGKFVKVCIMNRNEESWAVFIKPHYGWHSMLLKNPCRSVVFQCLSKLQIRVNWQRVDWQAALGQYFGVFVAKESPANVWWQSRAIAARGMPGD